MQMETPEECATWYAWQDCWRLFLIVVEESCSLRSEAWGEVRELHDTPMAVSLLPSLEFLTQRVLEAWLL